MPPTSPPTSPPPPGCPPRCDPPDYYERQIPLLHAANHIDATARGPVGPGYAGITIDVPACRVDVYWKGTLPYPVAYVVSIYDGPIDVEVHQNAPYSGAELHRPSTVSSTNRNWPRPPGSNCSGWAGRRRAPA